MKIFNITGTCFPDKNYMVDISEKLRKIMDMIEYGYYFTINRPRQYGKTTTMYLLRKQLQKTEGYLPIGISFEGIGDDPFQSENNFCQAFFGIISDKLEYENMQVAEIFQKYNQGLSTFKLLSKAISKVVNELDKKIVLFIDEVDKSSNNQIFFHFLGMLRDKYLERENIPTFHNVILAGVHDIKTLKAKIRPDEETKYNSPWNIAVDFKVEMCFNQKEIQSMLHEYVTETGYKMDIDDISERLYHWTAGYPFLVSKLCKTIDEELVGAMTPSPQNEWAITHIEEAVKLLLMESNTLFDDMVKNLENNLDLYVFIESIVLGNTDYKFNIHNPVMNLANLYGLIKQSPSGILTIHNRIFLEVISAYMASKVATSGRNISTLNPASEIYLKPDGRLNMDKVLLKFQEGIKEKYSKSDILKSDEFLEKDLRLLFLLFMKPILNSKGYTFKEVEIGAEKRLDVVVIYQDEKFIVELKIWRGDKYHQTGKRKLLDYMAAEGVDKGYMLICDKTVKKRFTTRTEDGILMVFI